MMFAKPSEKIGWPTLDYDVGARVGTGIAVGQSAVLLVEIEEEFRVGVHHGRSAPASLVSGEIRSAFGHPATALSRTHVLRRFVAGVKTQQHRRCG